MYKDDEGEYQKRLLVSVWAGFQSETARKMRISFVFDFASLPVPVIRRLQERHRPQDLCPRTSKLVELDLVVKVWKADETIVEK